MGGTIYHQNLEGIVILLDKFGTTINRPDFKIKTEELNEYNARVNVFIDKLLEINETEDGIPGHIRFKIINMNEKKNRNWIETLVDKVSKIKSIREVKEDFENEANGTDKKNSKEIKVKKLDAAAVIIFFNFLAKY